LLARDRWLELTNKSAECVQPVTALSTPKAQRTGMRMAASDNRPGGLESLQALHPAAKLDV